MQPTTATRSPAPAVPSREARRPRRSRHPRRSSRASRRYRLGTAPLLALVVAAGLALIAAGNNAARLGEAGGEEMFWAGLLLIYLPLTLRLFGRSASREERLVLAFLLGIGLYLVKVLHSPDGFGLHDEFASWRGVWDLQRTGHLFTANPLIGNFSVFPGMTAATAALSQLSGLSVFASALVLIGVARATMIVALFLILERASGSARVAGIAIAVYACNPSILYFDSQFGYESLALALAPALMLVVMRGAGFDRHPRVPPVAGSLAAIVLLAAGLVVTHHLTTYAMVAFFALWSGMVVLVKRRSPLAQLRGLRAGPALGCLVLGVLAAGWFAFVAGGATQDELGGVFASAASSAFDLVFGGSGAKTLFKAGTGEVDPLVVRLLGLASVGILVLVIPLGAWRVWRSERARPLSLSLAVVALLYPVTLVPRLTQAGSEISQRASEFVFVGVGFVAALLFVHLARAGGRLRSGAYPLIATLLAALVFVGGVILGGSPVTRQPGPYEVGAGSRSIGPQGLAAAGYAAAYLPRDSRILVDAPNGLLLGSYGHLDPVLGSIREIPVTRVFFSREFDAAVRTVLVRDAIDYVVVDRRLSTSLPVDGHYYERGEPGAFERARPVSPAALRKFEDVPGIGKVFDNGPIAIYDTSRLRPR
jgi:hypothetical protein